MGLYNIPMPDRKTGCLNPGCDLNSSSLNYNPEGFCDIEAAILVFGPSVSFFNLLEIVCERSTGCSNWETAKSAYAEHLRLMNDNRPVL